MGVRRFTELRAWQACDVFKQAILKLCSRNLARDSKLRQQLENAASGPTAHLAEGLGRFSPPDFARFTVMARSSLMEAQDHLRTAVHKGHITEEIRIDHDQLAEAALQETTGLMEYLQSAEALGKARKARERRDAHRAGREPRTGKAPNSERNAAPNPESNSEQNVEPRTQNGTEKANTNREARTQNRER